VKDSRIHEQALATLRPLEHPLTGRSLPELVNIAAQNTVEGFIAHDLLDFDGAVLHWSQVFHTLCPELDTERVVNAAESYTRALFYESKIKDDNNEPYLRVHHELWQLVRDELVEMSRFLGWPSAYGSETCDSYRYHAVSDDSHVKHTIEATRVLVKTLTGTEQGHMVLAGLYVSAFALHDRRPRTKKVVKRAIELMKIYYTVLFEAKYGMALTED